MNFIEETFAAMHLFIQSPHWEGVPVYIRAGKNLPVTCMEILVRLPEDGLIRLWKNAMADVL